MTIELNYIICKMAVAKKAMVPKWDKSIAFRAEGVVVGRGDAELLI